MRKESFESCVGQLRVFAILLIAFWPSVTFSSDTLWKFNDYTSAGKTTPGSDFSYSDGLSALDALGRAHWSGYDTAYYLYDYKGLGWSSCTATGCSARPKYESCYKPSGKSPQTRGLWKHSQYFQVPASDYVYGSAYDALYDNGKKAFDKTTSTSSFHFIDLVDYTCYSEQTCVAKARYKICKTSEGQSLATEDKWRYDSYGSYYYDVIPASMYEYGSGEAALDALGNIYFSRDTSTSSRYYEGLTDVACTDDRCTGKAKIKSCDKGLGKSPETEGKWRHSAVTSYGPVLVAPQSGYVFGSPEEAMEAAGRIAFNKKINDVSYKYIGLSGVVSCGPRNQSCSAYATVQICGQVPGKCSVSTDYFLLGANSGDCNNSISVEMTASIGRCPEYVSSSAMSAYEGSCPIVNGSMMSAESRASEYFARYEDPGEDDCVKNGNCGGGSCSTRLVGNPVNPVDGNKYQKFSDLQVTDGFTFARYYNSKNRRIADMGAGWSHNLRYEIWPEYAHVYSAYGSKTNLESGKYTSRRDACIQGWAEILSKNPSLSSQNITARYEHEQCRLYKGDRFWRTLPIYDNTGYSFENSGIIAYNLIRPDGSVKRFYRNGLAFSPENPEPGARLEVLGTRFTYVRPDLAKETYMGTRLVSLEYPNGLSLQFNYENGKLSRIERSDGAFLQIIRDQNGLIVSVEDQTGRTTGYAYDDKRRLVSVSYPDGTTEKYHYEDAIHPTYLTGITDRRNIRYATFAYDQEGRAILTEHAGGVGRRTISFLKDGLREVTNSLGVASLYKTLKLGGFQAVTEISGPGCSTCGTSNAIYEYDITGRMLLRKVENGIETIYGEHDEYRRPLFRIKANGTPLQKREDYIYDANLPNKLSTITQPSVFTGGNRVIEKTYTTTGNIAAYKISGFTPGGVARTREVLFQYNAPYEQVSLIDGPRTDVDDTIVFDYYADDSTLGQNRARLKRVIKAGIIIRDNIQYTPTGKVASEERPNGLTITNTYYPGNDRLQTRTETDGTIYRTTRWAYLPTGEVASITQAVGLPEETTIRFDYDDARRLTRITDALGNSIHFRLDTESNLTGRDITDSNGVLRRTLQQTFDLYNKLDQVQSENQIADYDYAADGTLSREVDGRGTVSVYDYDALKRLTSVQQDAGGLDTSTANLLTRYGYNVHDRLTSVTDPNNGTTIYEYDDFGNLLKQTSPDTGTTTYEYDEAGNRISRTDTRGVTTRYEYDALNRLTLIDQPGTAEDIRFIYDDCPNGVGRLCRIEDVSGVTEYTYDAFGDTTEVAVTHDGVRYVQAYAYDALGNITAYTMPSGRQVTLARDQLGQISGVTTDINGAPFNVAGLIRYAVDGQLAGMLYGNGIQETREYDLAGRLVSLTMPADSTLPAQQAANDPVFDAHNPGSFTRVVNRNAIGTLVILKLSDMPDPLLWYQDSTFRGDWQRITDITRFHAYPGKVLILEDDALSLWQRGGEGREPRYVRQAFDGRAWARQNGFLKAATSAVGTPATSVVWRYAYDPNGNLVTLSTSDGPSQYDYDALNRLVRDAGAALPEITYTYDPNGNRLIRTEAGAPTTLEYAPDSNRLTAIDGIPRERDPAGNLTADRNGARTFEYTAAGRLWKVYENGQLVATYTYNALGQRVRKDTSTEHIVYHYDLSGRLIAETRPDGTPIRDYLHLATRPVAQIDITPDGQETLTYLHTDHLGTPRSGTDENGVVVWQWRSSAFGEQAPDEDPDGDGVLTTVNLRFPGQYFDGETGFYYNYFRYYDSSTGRYLTSDPIGLDGDLNTYGYVSDNPMKYIDQYGLFKLHAYQYKDETYGYWIEFEDSFKNGTLSCVSGFLRDKSARFVGGIWKWVARAQNSIHTYSGINDAEEKCTCRHFEYELEKWFLGQGYVPGYLTGTSFNDSQIDKVLAGMKKELENQVKKQCKGNHCPNADRMYPWDSLKELARKRGGKNPALILH